MSVASVHAPVMRDEALALLAPCDGAVYLDATLGGGGYTTAILAAAACRVVAIDRDLDACRRADALVAAAGGRLVVVHGRFAAMVELLAGLGIAAVDGVAFDLGVSSDQIDTPARGFSFRVDGPLDMRMDRDQGPTAADVVNALAAAELARILSEFGEERAARRIAAAIVDARKDAPILTTQRLAGIVRTVLPRAHDGLDPATRTFQALRIYVNDELGELDRGLAAAERLLAPGGRLVVVAFHSLEDRRVKAFLRARSGGAPHPSRHLPAGERGALAPSFRPLTAKALRPSAAEVAANPRARSARLRAAERTEAAPWPVSSTRRRAA